MKKFKTLGLSIGALAALTMPVVTAVSCNNDSTGPSKPAGPNTPAIPSTTIDITNKSADQTVDAIVRELKINMDVIGQNEDAWSLAADLTKVKRYMEQIDVNKKIVLVNGDSSYTMDFSPVKQWVDKIIDAINQQHNPNIGDGGSIGAALSAIGMPEIAVYAGLATTITDALGMATFMELTTDDFSQTGVDKTAFFANHGYIQMLNEYHKIIWEFVQSDFYQEWSVGKTFNIFDDKNPIAANTGEWYDDSHSANLRWNVLQPPMYNGEFQSSNFEVAFGLRLLNVSNYIERSKLPAILVGLTKYYDDSSYTLNWSGIKSDYPDFTDANYNSMWDRIETLPTGWESVDYMVVNSAGTALVPVPGFESAVNGATLTSANAFYTGTTLYWKP